MVLVFTIPVLGRSCKAYQLLLPVTSPPYSAINPLYTEFHFLEVFLKLWIHTSFWMLNLKLSKITLVLQEECTGVYSTSLGNIAKQK